jgi:hypothetical protein
MGGIIDLLPTALLFLISALEITVVGNPGCIFSGKV